MNNQDVVLWAENRRLAGVFLADGVSGCPRSDSGARLCCEAMQELLMKKGPELMEYEPAEIAAIALNHVTYGLRKLAAREGSPVEAYSSTMAWALLDRKSGRLMMGNLGDSLIGGVGADGRVTILAAPDRSGTGCCTTTTVGAENRTAVVIRGAEDLKLIFLCSDGAWNCLFSGNRIRSDLAEALGEGDCGTVVEYLNQTPTPDDRSFISMKLNTTGGYPDERTKILKA